MAESAISRGPLILVETFELTAPFADYEQAVSAFCRKVETDGLAEVLAMQFYADRGVGEAYLILMFNDAAAFDNHMSFIRSLDETAPYGKTVKLKQIRAFGEVNAETAKRFQEGGRFEFQWISEHVTGFIRNPAPRS